LNFNPVSEVLALKNIGIMLSINICLFQTVFKKNMVFMLIIGLELYFCLKSVYMDCLLGRVVVLV